MVQKSVIYNKGMSSRIDILHCNAIQIFKFLIIHSFSRSRATFRKTSFTVILKHEHPEQIKIIHYSVRCNGTYFTENEV